MTELIVWRIAAMIFATLFGFVSWRLYFEHKRAKGLEIDHAKAVDKCIAARSECCELGDKLQRVGEMETFMQDIQHQINSQLETGGK